MNVENDTIYLTSQLLYIAKQKDRSIAPIFYFIYKVYCDFARSESECFTVNIVYGIIKYIKI